MIILVCAIGAYTVNNAFFDIIFMLMFGVIGYVFKKLNYPLAPMVLALVLGDMAESSFRQSMLLSNGSVSIFWSNALVASIMGLAMLMLFWPLISRVPGLVSQVGEVARRQRRRRVTRRDGADGRRSRARRRMAAMSYRTILVPMGQRDNAQSALRGCIPRRPALCRPRPRAARCCPTSPIPRRTPWWPRG